MARKKYSSPEYDEAQRQYLKENYTHFIISLKKGEDDDLFNTWQDARDAGYTTRGWLRLMFYGEED